MIKKIIFISFFLFIPNINAECKIEERISMGYISENSEYEIDYNDYKINYGEWKLEMPIEGDFETRETLYSSDVLPVRYIHLYNFGHASIVYLNEIMIKYNGVLLNTEMYCEGCSTNAREKMRNGNEKFENSYVMKGGYIRLDLLGYYNLDSLTAEIYMTDLTTNEKKYEISTTREKSLDRIYTSIFDKNIFLHRTEHEVWKKELKLGNLPFINPEYKEYSRLENPTLPTKFKNIIPKTEYRVEERLYKHYKNVVKNCDIEIIYKDKIVEIEKPIEKIIYKDKIVEKPIEKIIYKDKIVEIEKPIEKIIYKENNSNTTPLVCKTEKTSKSSVFVITLLSITLIARGIFDIKNKYLR